MDLLVPPASVAAGLLGALALPALLIALSHPPFRVLDQSRLWRLSVGGMLAVWAAALLLLPGGRPVPEVVAGILILPTAVLVGFSFWTLLAHGFTISMLLSLIEAGRPLTMDEWIKAYGGAGLDVFAGDRLQVLFRFGMVVGDGAAIRATPRGVLTGRLVWLGLAIFNIDPEAVA